MLDSFFTNECASTIETKYMVGQFCLVDTSFEISSINASFSDIAINGWLTDNV